MTDRAQNTLAGLLFGVIAGLVGTDLLADAGAGAGSFHLGAEGTATILSVAGAVWFVRRAAAEHREALRWRARAEELLGGVGRSVQHQFEAWSLSPAEAEVGLLLLKGLSFKEIAAVRATGERTAREQARAVYRKGGVAGRAELSAWFIEDLL